MTTTYIFDLIGGPLDGLNDFTWTWLDTPEGREGERTGYLFFEGVRYQCNADKTKAHFLGGRPSRDLVTHYLHYDN